MVSSTASAAAQDTGLPPKVDAVLARARTARPPSPKADAGADGQAAAEALGQGEHVGADAVVLVGEPRPVRPMPVWISSSDQQRAVRVADLARGGEVAGRRRDDAALALGRLQEDRRGRLASTAASQRVGVAVRDEADVAGQRPERRRGSAALPVSASAPSVRPWKPSSAATTHVRRAGAGRASLSAASLASVPELQKNTRPPARPSRPSSRSASATPGSCTKRLEVCARVATWRVTASTSAGCAWPRDVTAMPPSRSR